MLSYALSDRDLQALLCGLGVLVVIIKMMKIGQGDLLKDVRPLLRSAMIALLALVAFLLLTVGVDVLAWHRPALSVEGILLVSALDVLLLGHALAGCPRMRKRA